jgi:hypothetical protein
MNDTCMGLWEAAGITEELPASAAEAFVFEAGVFNGMASGTAFFLSSFTSTETNFKQSV